MGQLVDITTGEALAVIDTLGAPLTAESMEAALRSVLAKRPTAEPIEVPSWLAPLLADELRELCVDLEKELASKIVPFRPRVLL